MILKGYAKVNIALDVAGRRVDGYHDVRMIMQTIPLYDEISVGRAEGSGEIFLTCDDKELPVDERNLAFKAASLVMRKFGINASVSIDIKKNIPKEAGLAGGSADAAAVINAMDSLFCLNMSEKQKDEIAVRLGADVPFCLRKGTYLSEGIGERLTKIADFPNCHMLLVKPAFGISTAWAYNEVDKKNNINHPDIDGLISAIEKGSLKEIAGLKGNVLETVSEDKYPEIREIKRKLEDMGAVFSMMSGSGPTVFGIFDDKGKAEKASKGFSGYQHFLLEITAI